MIEIRRRGFLHRIHRRLHALSRFLRKEAPYMVRMSAPLPLLGRRFVDCFAAEGIANRFFDDRKTFLAGTSSGTWSTDWFTNFVGMWKSGFERCGFDAASEVAVLEIGSWEGMSSLFILKTFPKARLTCVDTWEGGDEHTSGDGYSSEQVSAIERRFDHNTREFADRVVKAKGTSLAYFAAANPRIVEFDIVYVDGSHFGSDVVMDAVYAWDKLRVGGMMILDDYFWRYYANDFDNPGAAINAFLRIKTGSWQVVHVYNQVILRKIRASVPIEPDDA